MYNKRFHSFWDRYIFYALIIAFVVVFFFGPILNVFGVGDWVTDLFLVFALLFSSLITGKNKKAVFFLSLLTLPIIGAILKNYFTGEAQFSIFLGFSIISFFCFTSYLMLRNIFRSKKVDANILMGAICVYFMIAVIGGFLYQIIVIYQPDAFHHLYDKNGSADIDQYMYFSMVTLTTLGYGDIVPVSKIARSVVVFQAFAGQAYLAVIVARLVGLQISHSKDKND